MAIEIEIKIKVDTHEHLIKKLSALGAGYKGIIVQKDDYFDSSDAYLVSLDSCLRLRSECDEHGSPSRLVLCYKGPKLPGRVKTRTEIETIVDKPDNMRQILGAVGYEVSLSFNKKREIWLLNGCEVCLDRLPIIGCFVEIEGSGEEKIIETANVLGLDINKVEKRSYACLVDEAIKKVHLPKRQVYLDDAVPETGIEHRNELDDDGFGLVYMIVNPGSGSGFAAALTGKLDDYFRGRGFGVRMNRISEFADIKRYMDLAKKSRDCVLIVVCGGDGTIREAAQNLVGSDKPLMVVPGGTENLLAHELGCDKKIDTYTEMFERQSIIPMDIVRVNDTCFTSILGIGFDAEIVHRVSKNRTGNITYSDYVWPIWRAFWSHKMPCFAVKADGREIFSGRGMLFAGNIARYATGLRILNKADLSDGMFDVCVCPCQSRYEILKYLFMIMFGRHTAGDKVVYKKCRSAEIVGLEEGIITQIDGDPGPALPLKLEIVPAAVRVFIAESKTKQGTDIN